MRVVQFLSVLSRGDAVSNDCLAIHKMLLTQGLDAHLCVEKVLRKPDEEVAIEPIAFCDELTDEDVAILHLSTGCFMNKRFSLLTCKKAIIYHNITPSRWFRNYDEQAYASCLDGFLQTRALSKRVDYAIVDSEFNRIDLMAKGFRCPIDVVPILIPFEDYKAEPNQEIVNRYQGKPGANILFTGRVAPNKCHEDIIKAFWAYKKHYDPDARLFLVGAFNKTDRYGARLLGYVEDLDLDDVYFPGHIGFDEILAYYKIADVFLCQSEHEGFCIPLVEAMMFDTPIVAYDSTAVGETLGGAGILLDEKDPFVTAGVMDRVVRNEGLRANILEGQRRRLEDFSYEKTSERLSALIRGFVGA